MNRIFENVRYYPTRIPLSITKRTKILILVLALLLLFMIVILATGNFVLVVTTLSIMGISALLFAFFLLTYAVINREKDEDAKYICYKISITDREIIIENKFGDVLNSVKNMEIKEIKRIGYKEEGRFLTVGGFSFAKSYVIEIYKHDNTNIKFGSYTDAFKDSIEEFAEINTIKKSGNWIDFI